MAWFSFSMEPERYWDITNMHYTWPQTEYRRILLGALTILEQVIAHWWKHWVEKSTPPEHEFVHTHRNWFRNGNSSNYPQLRICPLHKIKNTTYRVYTSQNPRHHFGILINSTKIYLVQEESSQNKENYMSDSEQKFGKGSKGNKLKAPYKERQSEIKNINNLWKICPI